MKTEHIAELDGVRGIAILLVMGLHACLYSAVHITGWVSRLASYGFAGVDLFFVLSGFLITGILLRSKGKSAYFRNFYLKRALRIWPLYYLLLFVAFALVPLAVTRAHLQMGELDMLDSRKVWVYAVLLQNVWYPPPGPTILGMTWSLAIEEQFYVVWPWLVLLFDRSRLATIAISVLLISPVLRVWAQHAGVNASDVYFLTPYRLDGLAFGALLALFRASPAYSLLRLRRAALVMLSLGLPGALWFLAGRTPSAAIALKYSMLALASVGTVAFAVWASETGSRLGRPFTFGPLRYIGKVSYCLYLVNQPVYYALGGRMAHRFVGDSVPAAVGVMVLGFAACLAIATGSWYLFESRILALKGRLT